jgi:hypothetical protein
MTDVARASDIVETGPEGDGWRSRKLIIAIAGAGATMAGAFVGGVLLGQYDAALTWHGRISESGAIELIWGSLGLLSLYCGFNVVERGLAIAGQIFAARK